MKKEYWYDMLVECCATFRYGWYFKTKSWQEYLQTVCT